MGLQFEGVQPLVEKALQQEFEVAGIPYFLLSVHPRTIACGVSSEANIQGGSSGLC